MTPRRSPPPPPDHDRLTGPATARRAARRRRRRRPDERLAQRLAGGVELGDQLLVARREGGDPVLEVEDAAHALDADAGRGEVGDLAEQLDVARRSSGARRRRCGRG